MSKRPDLAPYFRRAGETLSDFRAQWMRLSEVDKEQLKQGIGDGTLNY